MPPKKKNAQKPTALHQEQSNTRNSRSKNKTVSQPKSEPEPRKKVKGVKKVAEQKVPNLSPQKNNLTPQKNKEKADKGKKQEEEKGSAEQKEEEKKKKGKKESRKEEKAESSQAKQSKEGGQKKQGQQKKQEEELKKVILKGTVPVDQYFSRASAYKVYCDKDNIYAATLNQCNIDNNNNKFYILQILVNENNPTDLVFYTRWGRVGVTGQKSEEKVKSIEAAIKDYNKKLNDKKKTYTVVEMNYEENATAEEPKPANKDQPESKLHPAVQDLIRLIFDMKMMANQMKEIGYDAKKMPLGKLAKTSISKGYQILQSLMEEIKRGASRNEDKIKELSSSFYSEIPHDFGFKNMANFVLGSEQKVKQKLEMLQSLQDIQVFTRLLDEGSLNADINQLDSNYAKLNIGITPLDKDTPTYQLLLKYVANTHASTHTAYRLTVLDIFQLDKQVETARYTAHIPNKMLLWHGSRLTNFVGILSQGLRIAPPEAPVTGYMFGKGVYFADMVTKSANYCFTSRENNVALMLLCEVALGEVNQKFYADYYANLLPEGKKSTKGCGKNAPRAEGNEMLGDVIVPCGEGVSTGLKQTALLYNEFIVYDVGQIKCRYLFKMKFNYV